MRTRPPFAAWLFVLMGQTREPSANVAGPETYLDGQVVFEGDAANSSRDRLAVLKRGDRMRYGYRSYKTVRVIEQSLEGRHDQRRQAGGGGVSWASLLIRAGRKNRLHLQSSLAPDGSTPAKQRRARAQQALNVLRTPEHRRVRC